jgi:glycosyltransferase involved in cell wall biosynthesis
LKLFAISLPAVRRAAIVEEPRILHIAGWYPDSSSAHRALFVKEHFSVAKVNGQHRLVHVEVRYWQGNPHFTIGKLSDCESFMLLFAPLRRAFIVESLTYLMLVFLRLRLGLRDWDCVNVHVAWPLLRFPRLFVLLFGRAVCVTDHWSAYHSNFNLPAGSRGHRKLARMFAEGLPVMVVSEALGNDIRRFAKAYEFPVRVVPNVVDPKVFHPALKRSATPPFRFLMVANWARIKRPVLALEAFDRLLAEGVDARLRIVGEGEQTPGMVAFVQARSLGSRVEFLGNLPKAQVAEQMREASALLHPSDYETFSVVCAEAVACGTPVIASKLEAIADFIDETNGILVENDDESWQQALRVFCTREAVWDHDAIARAAHERFRPEKIGAAMHEVYRLAMSR